MDDVDSLFSYPPSNNAYPADPPAAVARAQAAPVPERIRASCEDAAQSRVTAAADQGFDETVQQTVHAQAYASCLDWQSRVN